MGTAMPMFVTYRATEDAESRRRMRWMLRTLLAGALAFLLAWTVPGMIGWTVPPTNLIVLLFLPPTLALRATILRYRLFDVEVIIRWSLLFGSLAASVAGIFLAGAWVLSRVLGVHPGLAAALAAGLAGLTAPPLHSFLRQRAGRLVYRERDDPFEVPSRLGRIDAAADPQQALQAVTQILAHSLRLPFAAIKLRRPCTCACR